MRDLPGFACDHRRRQDENGITLCLECGQEVRFDANWPTHPWTTLADLVTHRTNDPAGCARQPVTFAMARMEAEREAATVWDILARVVPT